MARLYDLMLEVVRRLSFCISLASASCVLAQDALDWQTAEALTLEAGERRILLLEQQGFDLAVRVTSAGELISVQDGPDSAFGTELVVLENQGAVPRDFQIQLAPVLKLASPDYRITRFESSSPEDWTIALALYNASQTWYRIDSSADEVIGLLEPLKNTPASSELQALLWMLLSDAVVRSGQSERAIALLSAYLSERGRNNPKLIYLHWQNVIALYQGLYVQEALEQAELLASALEAIPSSNFANAVEEQWLRSQVQNSLAAVRVGASRLQGDDALLQSAGEIFKANLEAVQSHPDISLQARLTEYLAGFYSFSAGRSNQISSQLLEQAESLYREAGDEIPLSALRNNQAYAALGRGDVNEALKLYLEALELRSHSKHQEGNAFVRARLGYLYFILGDYHRAQVRYEESIGIYRQLGLIRRLVHNQLELAEVLRAAGQTGRSLELLLDIQANLSGDAPLEERLRLASQLAHGLLDSGDAEAAEEVITVLEREFALDTDNGRERLEFASRLFYVLEYDILRARLLLAHDQVEQAREVVSAALAQLDSTTSEPLQQLELLHLQMLAGKAEQDDEALLASGQRALALVDAVRNDVDYQFQGARWTSRTAHIQQLMVSSYLQRYITTNDVAFLDAAVDLGQQYTAIGLRQSRMANRRDNGRSSAEDSRAGVAQLRQELVSALLAGASTSEVENALARAEEDYQRRRMPGSADSSRLVSLTRSDIQQHLGASEMALLFSLGDDGSHLVVLEQDSHTVFTLPSRRAFEGLVTAAMAEMETSGSSLDAVRQLARILLPAELELQGRDLLIEADGELTRIPFNVLAYYRSEEVLAMPAVAMVPSLSEFFASESAGGVSETQRLDVAIVADPVVSAGSATLRSSEPQFPRLPYTQVEADTIIASFGVEQTQVFLGEDANIANLQRESSRTARILHIASHGFASEDDPLMLGLALSNFPGSSVASGLLTVEQISAIPFDNELVVVSACETGVGQALNGEPLMSLGRMFLASGAKSALTTLWPISDRANAEFMSHFYEALAEQGLPPQQALTYAQKRLMEVPRYRHPFYWGAFQYQAVRHDARPVYF